MDRMQHYPKKFRRDSTAEKQVRLTLIPGTLHVGGFGAVEEKIGLQIPAHHSSLLLAILN
jgi:hypothetical protein